MAGCSSPNAPPAVTWLGYGNFLEASASQTNPLNNACTGSCKRNWASRWRFTRRSSPLLTTTRRRGFTCASFVVRGNDTNPGRWVARRFTGPGQRSLPSMNFPRQMRGWWQNCVAGRAFGREPSGGLPADSDAARVAAHSLPVKLLDDSLEGVFPEADDADLTLGVFRGVAGVSGVDHDIRAELLADRAGWRLGRIGRAEDVADLVHRVDPFIDQRDAFFGAGLAEARGVAFAGGPAGHELDDALELVFAKERAQEVAQLLGFSGRDGEAQVLLQCHLGPRRDDVFEFGAQDLFDRGVELHRVGDAHAVDLDADDIKASPGKEIDDVAGPAGGETEVVRLDQDEGALRLVIRTVGDGPFHDAGVLL